ncbi:MAG: phosphatase PAP2 family protein [Methanobacteriaceae archaeon]|nr:MAG: phosphatase PAP2 family protein [Methanobacterium sp. BRmetb2]MCC7558785.1 phosphatase PAP2 family protein [Methanobacteriaceae archaeon]
MLNNLTLTLTELDVSIFYLINVQIHNHFLDVIMPVITIAGTQIFWVLICIYLFIFRGEKGRNTALLIIIALILGYVITELLKMGFARPRPYTVLDEIRFFIFIGGYSLPSGHSAASFIGCTIIGLKYGYLIPLLLFAFLVGFSRIYIGVHYPFDVVIGAVIGILCSLLVLRYEDNILRMKDKLINKVS